MNTRQRNDREEPIVVAWRGSVFRRLIAAAALLATAHTAFAHDGEDHAAPPPPVTQSVAPRVAVATDEFEVVLVAEGKRLTAFVDRFDSNEPVAKAKVEIDGAGLKGAARETAPGTYVIDAAANIPTGKLALTVSIETADSADLLSAILDTTGPRQDAEHVHSWDERLIWSIAALLMLASGALLLLRQRRNRNSAR